MEFLIGVFISVLMGLLTNELYDWTGVASREILVERGAAPAGHRSGRKEWRVIRRDARKA